MVTMDLRLKELCRSLERAATRRLDSVGGAARIGILPILGIVVLISKEWSGRIHLRRKKGGSEGNYATCTRWLRLILDCCVGMTRWMETMEKA